MGLRILLLLCLFPSSGWSDQSCETIFQTLPMFQKLHQLEQVQSAYRHFRVERKDIYRPSECHYNVVELKQRILKRHPHLDESDFAILLIAPHLGIRFGSTRPQDGFYSFQSRYSKESFLPVATDWMLYHFVLLYQDRVLDLDFATSDELIPLDDYLAQMFHLSLGQSSSADSIFSDKKIALWKFTSEEFHPLIFHQTLHAKNPIAILSASTLNPYVSTNSQK